LCNNRLKFNNFSTIYYTGASEKTLDKLELTLCNASDLKYIR